MATTFKPTEEQTAAVDLALEQGSLAIEALAGAGKTSTLRLISEALGESGDRGQYMAFNRKIVDDAKGSFPWNVSCSTAHGLAMKSVGRDHAHKLNSNRMTNAQMARVLKIDRKTFLIGDGVETFTFAPAEIAGLAHRTVAKFCSTADLFPGLAHVPFQRGLDAPGSKDYPLMRELAATVAPIARVIWEDIQSTRGRMRFEHNHYLKMWQLREPRINADFVLFDEAQDANPVMMSIVEAQDHAQRIWVGDNFQRIYGWNGAVNAMQLAAVDARARLSVSFRFGPEIAEQANIVLARLDPSVQVEGRGKTGRVEMVEHPDVYLARTNAQVVVQALLELEQGRRPFVQGGVKDVTSFAEAAMALMLGERTSHPELACFKSWTAVQEYSETDDGADLAPMVRLIDEFSPQVILEKVAQCGIEAGADCVISTAHKSKGAEWGSVGLLEGFAEGPDAADADLRLMYVAVTRAMGTLDRSAADLEGVWS